MFSPRLSVSEGAFRDTQAEEVHAPRPLSFPPHRLPLRARLQRWHVVVDGAPGRRRHPRAAGPRRERCLVPRLPSGRRDVATTAARALEDAGGRHRRRSLRGLAERAGHLHHPARRPSGPARHGAEPRHRLRLLARRRAARRRLRLAGAIGHHPLPVEHGAGRAHTLGAVRQRGQVLPRWHPPGSRPEERRRRRRRQQGMADLPRHDAKGDLAGQGGFEAGARVVARAVDGVRERRERPLVRRHGRQPRDGDGWGGGGVALVDRGGPPRERGRLHVRERPRFGRRAQPRGAALAHRLHAARVAGGHAAGGGRLREADDEHALRGWAPVHAVEAGQADPDALERHARALVRAALRREPAHLATAAHGRTGVRGRWDLQAEDELRVEHDRDRVQRHGHAADVATGAAGGRAGSNRVALGARRRERRRARRPRGRDPGRRRPERRRRPDLQLDGRAQQRRRLRLTHRMAEAHEPGDGDRS